MINRYIRPKEKGLKKVIVNIKKEKLEKIFMNYVAFIYHELLTVFSPLIIYFKPKRFLIFNDRKIPYFYHKYNLTWKNERAIEVPLIFDLIKKRRGNILEVGNVLPHYFFFKHDVLDKYEKEEGVINQDVIDFNPSNKYDLIVSISTLEHVGFDDNVNDPKKIIKAIKNLKKNCLKKGGEMIITMPINYNPSMDKLLFNNKLGFDKENFFGRYKKEWKEITKNETIDLKYVGDFDKGANAIVIGFIKNSKNLNDEDPFFKRILP